MLRFFFVFILLVDFFAVCAQNTEKLNYYALINKADSLILEKKLDKAYSFYSKAITFSTINPYTDLEFVKLCLKVKKFKTAKKFLKIAIKNGAFLGMLEADSNLNKFFKKDQQWEMTYDVLRQQHLATIPHLEERMVLLNMLEKDQALRSLLGVIEYKKADSLIFASDTANISVIIRMVEKIGFPDREKVGTDGANAIFILLLHTLNNGREDEKNLRILTPLIKQAVQELKYPPFYMGIVIDRNKAMHKQKQVYGTYWEIGKNNKKIITPIENIGEVDKRRKEIGLPSLFLAKKILGLELPIDYKSN